MDVLDGGPAPDATTRRDAGSPRLDAGPGGDGSLCSECDTHGDCAAGHYCVALTAGGNACLPACIGDLPECPRDFRCVTDIGAGIPDPLCQPVGKPCCLDEDEDGYGHGVGCLGLDCDDRDSSVHAGQSEICNGRDDDCDGAIDEGCPSDVGLGVATNGTSYGGSGGSAESLSLCRIAPSRPGRELSRERAEALWTTLVELMQRATEDGCILTAIPEGADRATIPEEETRLVYRQLRCRRCGETIEARPICGRIAYFCPRCQPD